MKETKAYLVVTLNDKYVANYNSLGIIRGGFEGDSFGLRLVLCSQVGVDLVYTTALLSCHLDVLIIIHWNPL